MAFALLSEGRGIRTIVIAREPKPGTPGTLDAPDARPPYRPIALSYASAQLLEGLGVLDMSDATPITRIHVSQRASFGRTVMDAADHAIPALGYVVEAGDLGRSTPSAYGELVASGQVGTWLPQADGIAVEWTGVDGVSRQTRTRLLVLADGGESSSLWERDYGQRAVVCTVRSSIPHCGVAYERFTPGGALAFLPCKDRYAVVWSMPAAQAEELAGGGDDLFLKQLQENFGERRGQLSSPGMRLAYPLALRRNVAVHPRIITIGNAAQTLHPVAGQGLNLGLRDAVVLADELSACSRTTIGTDSFVKRFYRRRRIDRAATIAMTDLLARGFAVDHGRAALLRGVAMTALDAFSPARNFFARRMMLGARGTL